VLQALPAEAWWFASYRTRHLRRLLLRLYWITLKRLITRRLLRIKPIQ
jgi:hypothetical protein